MQDLIRIQRELKAPKNHLNKFGGYYYRNCEDILEGVKPLLGDCTLTMNDEIVMIGDRYYVKATVALSNGKDSCSVCAYAREPINKKGMDDMQLTGAVSSYARKYALNGLFCIDDVKDADSMDNTDCGKAPKQQKPKGISKTIFDGMTEDQKKQMGILYIHAQEKADAEMEGVVIDKMKLAGWVLEIAEKGYPSTDEERKLIESLVSMFSITERLQK